MSDPRARAEQLINHLQEGKQVTELFADSLERTYLIYGKPMREWRSYFRISIPESPDTSQCKALAAKLAALFQEASFYFAVAEAQVDALMTGQEKEYTTHFNQLIAEYKEKGERLPATQTLEAIANGGITDINGAISNAKIIRNFWKRMLESLTETRKLVENATWNNHIESKHSYDGNIPSNLPNRGSFGEQK